MESEKNDLDEEFPTGRGLLKFLDGRFEIISVPIVDNHFPATVAKRDGPHFHAVENKNGTVIYEECNEHKKM